MRILYLLPSLKICGGIRVALTHCEKLAERGHEVWVFSREGDTEPESKWFPLSKTKVLTSTNLLFNLPTVFNSDAVVATHALSTARLALLWPGVKRRYYLVQMRESYFYPEGSKEAKKAEETYSYPLRCIAISSWLKAFLEAEYGHRDVPLVRNGVDLKQFFPEKPRWQKSRKVRVLIEGYEANFAKNISHAHEASRPLTGEIEVWGYNQKGPGDFHYDRFFLKPSGEKLRHIYNSCDFLLKTTRYEGSALAPTEAMACGLPVIQTSSLGVDYLVDGYNGLLVPYGDIEKIRQAIRKILAFDCRKKLGINALNYARKNFIWDDKIDKLEKVLSEK